MTETKRKMRTRKGAKARAVQQTLKDMFGGRTSSQGSASEGPLIPDVEITIVDTQDDTLDEVTETAPHVVTEPAKRRSIKPTTNSRLVVPASQPTRMFAIFKKKEAEGEQPQVIQIPDSPANEIIEIMSEDISSPEAGSSRLSPDRQTPPPVVNHHMSTPTDGTTRDDPIVIESSPVKASATHSVPGPMWSIFKRRSAQSSSNLKERQKATKEMPTPFPDQLSQHVRGPQSEFSAGSLAFSHQRRQVAESVASISDDLSNRVLGDILCSDTTWHSVSTRTFPVDAYIDSPEDYIGTIPRTHRRHPAVVRSLQRAGSRSPDAQAAPCQETWTERWCPRRADDVIGNEERALYLRDWLIALRIQMSISTEEVKQRSKKRKLPKSKKPEVVRHVKKRRKLDYDALGDFVASDDDDVHEDDILGPDEDDFEFCKRMQDHLGYSSATTPDASSQHSSEPGGYVDDIDDSLPFPYTPPNFKTQIHNTIVLAGPSGCGKTAAVYACAEELGWEVFEVYPGIGERNGPELNRLIGDIGKNHIVQSTLRRWPVHQQAYFAPGSKRGKKTVLRVDSDEEEEEDVTTPTQTEPGIDDIHQPIEQTIKQSLVLIEEVDVLYRTDTGFWPAIINIIKECRRPVVLTCNDINLVPWLDLPLQTTLNFVPCPSSLAASYLQASCLSEGFAVPRDSIIHLYDGTVGGLSSSHRLQQPQHNVCQTDLRFTINQLQYWTSDLSRASAVRSMSGFDDPSIVKDGRLSFSLDNDRMTEARNATSPYKESRLKDIFRSLDRFCDSLSYIEDQLSHSPSDSMKLFDDHATLADTELGYTVLPLEHSSHPSLVSAFHSYDRLLSKEALGVSRRIIRGVQTERSLFNLDPSVGLLSEDRSAFVAQVHRVVHRCRGTMPCSDSDSTLHTDYLPWIRYMVNVDNALEELISPPGTQQGRQTRNSKKAAQERHIDLDTVELEVLAKTAFRMDE